MTVISARSSGGRWLRPGVYSPSAPAAPSSSTVGSSTGFRGRTSPERSGRTAEVYSDGDEGGAPPAAGENGAVTRASDDARSESDEEAAPLTERSTAPTPSSVRVESSLR